MQPGSSPAVLFAVGSAVVLSLFAVLDVYRITTVVNEQQPDPYRVGFQEPRLREVRKTLPEGPVAFVSNLNFNSLRGAAAFFATQYELAPHILVPLDSPHAGDVVLGSFSADVETSDITSRLARENKLRVLRDYDAGVVLFRREKTQ